MFSECSFLKILLYNQLESETISRTQWWFWWRKAKNCKVTNALFCKSRWLLDKIWWKLGASVIIDCYWRSATIYLNIPPSPWRHNSVSFSVGIPNEVKWKWSNFFFGCCCILEEGSGKKCEYMLLFWLVLKMVNIYVLRIVNIYVFSDWCSFSTFNFIVSTCLHIFTSP